MRRVRWASVWPRSLFQNRIPVVCAAARVSSCFSPPCPTTALWTVSPCAFRCSPGHRPRGGCARSVGSPTSRRTPGWISAVVFAHALVGCIARDASLPACCAVQRVIMGCGPSSPELAAQTAVSVGPPLCISWDMSRPAVAALRAVHGHFFPFFFRNEPARVVVGWLLRHVQESPRSASDTSSSGCTRDRGRPKSGKHPFASRSRELARGARAHVCPGRTGVGAGRFSPFPKRAPRRPRLPSLVSPRSH